MKFSSTTLASLFLLLTSADHVAGRESVAELRRLRALGSSSGYHFGGDNGRDHPQNYPKAAPVDTPVKEDTTKQDEEVSLCVRESWKEREMPEQILKS